MTVTIYKIMCLANQRQYIGSTIRPKKRYRNHVSALEQGKHWTCALQNDWNAYGAESFTFTSLQECSSEDRFSVETLWIERAGDDRYNVCTKAATRGPDTEEKRLRVAAISREHIKRLRLAGKLGTASAEHRLRASERMKRFNQDKEFQKKAHAGRASDHMANMTKKLVSMTADIWTTEKRQAQKDRINKLWANPEFRARRIAQLRMPRGKRKPQ